MVTVTVWRSALQSVIAIPCSPAGVQYSTARFCFRLRGITRGLTCNCLGFLFKAERRNSGLAVYGNCLGFLFKAEMYNSWLDVRLFRIFV